MRPVARMRDYYEILQVLPDADTEVIAAAYRSLARKFHPDHSRDAAAEQRMRELNEAYAVLGDPDSRRKYDIARPKRPAPFVPPSPVRARTEEMRRPSARSEPTPVVATPAQPKRRRSARPVVLVSVWFGCLVGAIAATWTVWSQEMDRPLPVPTQRATGAATPTVVAPFGLPYRSGPATVTATPQP